MRVELFPQPTCRQCGAFITFTATGECDRCQRRRTMNSDIDMEAVRRALQLTTNEMHEVHLIRHRKPSMEVNQPIVGYSLKFDRDAELTVTHLAALAVVFGTRSIRVKYIPSGGEELESGICGELECHDYEPSELTVEVCPDA